MKKNTAGTGLQTMFVIQVYGGYENGVLAFGYF